MGGAVLLLLIGMSACDGSESAATNAVSVAPRESGSVIDAANVVYDARSESPTLPTNSIEPYTVVLAACVADNGMVRYEVLAQGEHRNNLDAVIADFALQPLPPESPPQARLAWLCNVYNANGLRLALIESRKDGFKSVRETPGFFDAMPVTVASEVLTLDELSSRIRAMRDPRVHAALVWGAISCPPLRAEPYDAGRLDAQLNEQCRRWLDDQSKNRAARTGIVLSEIFQRHAGDFDVPPYDGVVGFVRKHSRPNGNLRDFIRSVTNLKIEYAPFDWALNQAAE